MKKKFIRKIITCAKLFLIILSIGLSNQSDMMCQNGGSTRLPDDTTSIDTCGYPYFVCLQDEFPALKVICISDIAAWEAQQIGSGGTILNSIPRKALPVCLNAIFPPCANVQPVIYGDVEVSDYSSIIEDMEKAAYEWNCLCGKQDKPCQTTINIKYIFDCNKYEWPLEKESLKYILGVTPYTVYWQGIKNKTGDVLAAPGWCNPANDPQFVSTIYINMTSDFLFKKDEDGFLKRRYYYVTSDNIEEAVAAQANAPEDITLFDFQELLAHELGHALLLGHSDRYECIGDEASIMEAEAVPAEFPRRGLSIYDKCMFVNLYCPDLVSSINEYVPTYNVNVFPNPTKKELNIEFELAEETLPVSISICNAKGDVIQNIISKELFQTGKNIYTTQLNLTSGSYFAIIQIGNKLIMRQFIFEK